VRGHGLRHVDRRGVQESPRVQGRDERGHAGRLEVPDPAQAFGHEVGRGPLAVHQGKELGFPDLELVVLAPGGVGNHRIVVAPTQLEQLDLDAVGQKGAKPRGVRAGVESLVEVLLDLPGLSLGLLDLEGSVEDGPGVRPLGDRHPGPLPEQAVESDRSSGLPTPREHLIGGDHRGDGQEHREHDVDHGTPPHMSDRRSIRPRPRCGARNRKVADIRC
jgi:hypothetical protein